MELPYFSIIIPAYNSALTIGQCLDSIINQTYRNVEIIIVDGISADDTMDIVKKYAATYSKISWLTEKDEGIYDAMNKGIQLAKGEWIYFLGSDDEIFDPFTLNNVFDVVSASNYNVVYGNVLIKGNTEWANDGDIFDKNFDLPKLLNKNICHQSVFYKLGFIKKHNLSYNLRYKVLADWDFNLHCWALTKFYYTDKIIARFSGGGASTTKLVADDFNNEIIEKFLEYFKIHPYHKLTKQIPSYRVKELLSLRNKSPFFITIKNITKRILNR